MAFVVDPNPTFTHTVKVKVPVDGGFTEQSFKATYRVLPTDEVAGYDLSIGSGSSDFLKSAVVGMDDLADLHGNAISYNDSIRDQLLKLGYVRQALARTYFEAVAGSRSGN